jgi:hypothetical protein
MPTMDELFALKVQTQAELTSADKAVRNRAKKLGFMQRRFGKPPDGARCRDCVHLVEKRLAGTYRKCRLFGNTGGPGTDWQGRWPGCGKYEARS